jgi:uncharacterized repeat protein (TIGR03803 family)
MYISPKSLSHLGWIGALSAVLCFFGAIWMMPSANAATTYTVLHNFGDNSVVNDGTYSYSALVQGQNGSFYGTTAFGGAYGEGTIYEITSQGAVTILHSFQGTDGSFPETPLTVGGDGNLYGTTSSGGASSSGVFYQLTPTGTFALLHSFGATAGDGSVPLGALMLDIDGNFYTTTESGGAYGDGVVCQISLGGNVNILHSFGSPSVINDGMDPEAGLVAGTDGNLYGTTAAGGAEGDGTVFRISTAGAILILHSFGDGTVPEDGLIPKSGLIEGTNGYYYGTTSAGGSTEQPGAVTISNKVTTPASGGDGTVYQISSTGQESILHSFGDGTVTNDGQDPEAVLYQASDGNFYSTTVTGGASSEGTIYQITPSGFVTIFHSFGSNKDGAYPAQGLVQASDGNFYGTTSAGGSAGVGSVYNINFGLSAPTPAITPGGGAYTTSELVSITDGLAGAIIYYTTNGSAPTTSSIQYTGPITVSSSVTLQAIAAKSGYLNSSIASAAYVIGQTVATPSISPAGGTFNSPQTVTLSDSLNGAQLFYTTDGSTPAVGPAPSYPTLGTTIAYSGPFSVPASANINAIAVETGYFNSQPATAGFTIDVPSPTPVITPPGGKFATSQSVTITDPGSTNGAVILYTTDGSTPARGAPNTQTYTAPFILSGLNTTVNAIAFSPGDVQSATATAIFQIGTQVPAPTFSPPGGPYTTGQAVILTDPGATIYYTTDGSTPTVNSAQYTTPIAVSSSETITTYATEAGHFDSPVVSAAYTIGQTVPTPAISPNGGAFAASQTVTIAESLVGSTIFYTIDGSTPTHSLNTPTGTTLVYGGGILVPGPGQETIKSLAAYSGYMDSAVATAAFTIGSVVPTPTVSPAAGPYTTAQSVTLADTLASATIYYTTDGTLPTTSSTKYTAPVNVTASQTINAIAVSSGYINSADLASKFIIGQTVPTPGITPNGGPYSSNQQVSLSDTLPGVTIYYSTDAAAPAPTWTLYSGPFYPSGQGSETITAIASLTGYVTSAQSSATFTILPQASTPVISPAGGTFSSVQTVTITDPDPLATIYYTLDGSAPTENSTQYTGQFQISSSTVLSAVAVEPNDLNSFVAGAVFTINIPVSSPTFSPAGGSYSSAQLVTITDTSSPNAAIYYSTNASSASPIWYQYSSPISVTGSETITAKADQIGYEESPQVAATYTITQTFQKGLQLFSLPYTYSGVDVDTIFGYSGVKLAVWNPLTAIYSLTPTPPANQIVAGQGYWARFPQQVNVTTPGTPAPTNTPFIIALKPGWNMIGDPFPAAVALSSLTFNDGTESYSTASLGTSALISPTFYAYSAGATGYSAASSLEPDQGYWVYAYSATDLDVPVPGG